jgi:hypothetical protein
MSFITLDALQFQNITNFSISTICFLQHNLHENLFYTCAFFIPTTAPSNAHRIRNSLYDVIKGNNTTATACKNVTKLYITGRIERNNFKSSKKPDITRNTVSHPADIDKSVAALISGKFHYHKIVSFVQSLSLHL